MGSAMVLSGRGIAMLNLYTCYSCSDRDRGGNLCNAEKIAPEQRCANDFLWNDDYIAGIETSRKNVSARASADHHPVGTNDEDLLLVCDRGGSAGASQIPFSRLIGHKRDGRGVINLAAYQHEPWPLGNAQHVSSSHFDVRRGAGPALDIRIDVNYETAR